MAVEDKPPQRRPPWWVRLLLWGSNGRGGVLACMWILLALAGALVLAGFWNRSQSLGTILISLALGSMLSALSYWAAVRWVDRNGSWPDGSEPPT